MNIRTFEVRREAIQIAKVNIAVRQQQYLPAMQEHVLELAQTGQLDHLWMDKSNFNYDATNTDLANGVVGETVPSVLCPHELSDCFDLHACAMNAEILRTRYERRCVPHDDQCVNDRSAESMAQVLKDIRHWCVEFGVDFDAMNDLSLDHFLKESREMKDACVF